MFKSALVCGAAGFIGGHLARRLQREGFWVRGVDLKPSDHVDLELDDFIYGDLRDREIAFGALDRPFDEVYQLAADMGGAGYIFTGEHDADVMRNSAMININVLEATRQAGARRIFFSSSACIYPYLANSNGDARCCEESAYPAAPDSEYGWEKLFSERLYQAYARRYALEPRIARFHNIFGPEGTWRGGREKAPAAICRKVAFAADGGEIEIWGDGRQLRSFLYIDECLEGVVRLMRSDFEGPVNIGSEEVVSIDGLVEMIADVAGKRIAIRHVPGPVGVPGRNSDNRIIRSRLGWAPSQPLRVGLEATYAWIEQQVCREPGRLDGSQRAEVVGGTPIQ